MSEYIKIIGLKYLLSIKCIFNTLYNFWYNIWRTRVVFLCYKFSRGNFDKIGKPLSCSLKTVKRLVIGHVIARCDYNVNSILLIWGWSGISRVRVLSILKISGLVGCMILRDPCSSFYSYEWQRLELSSYTWCLWVLRV